VDEKDKLFFFSVQVSTNRFPNLEEHFCQPVAGNRQFGEGQKN
jgi:hypothetical protein